MKKTIVLVIMSVTLISGLLLGLTQTASAYGGSGNGGGKGYSDDGLKTDCTGLLCLNTSTELSSTPLSDAETNSLLFMVEEEKLARDVYQFLADKWSLQIFANIAQSEQAHMDSLLVLIDRYDLTSPVSASAGVFTNSELQTLYSELTAKGSQSLADALLVGGAIEELDILDLQADLANVTHTDINQVYNNLLSGSYNHLQAFASEYALQTGSVYTPQYLDATAFQTALDSAGLTGGPASSNGMGNGGYGRR